MNSTKPFLPSSLATFLTLLTLFIFMPPARAANQFPPGKMPFQGFLTDAANPPVPLGNTSPANKIVIFKVYKSATGAAAADVLWAESQVVTVDKGHFSVLLGAGSAVTGFTDKHLTDLSSVFVGDNASDRWIGLTVDDAEITPRIQFFAAPYAQLARAANSLVGPTGQTTLNLANGKLEGTAELTLNPGPLTVTGNATVSGSATLGSATVTGNATMGSATVTGNATVTALYVGDLATVNGLLSLGGALGNTKLAVYDGGVVKYGLGVGANQFRLHTGSLSDRFSFLNAPDGTEVMTIKGDGRVGIGTTDPRGALDVRGSLGANSWTYLGGATLGIYSLPTVTAPAWP
ncbi:MAG: hypothetical protein O2960_21545 [Verrucomicrobia bacterium]|nr:hypothetical protein [Verrucomicrobiota bacterium]